MAQNPKRYTNSAVFMPVVLDVLRELGGSGRPSQVKNLVAKKLSITDEERAAAEKNGVSRIDSLIEWGRFYLAKAGFLDAHRRGIWALTPKGHSSHLTSDEVKVVRSDVERTLRQLRIKDPPSAGRVSEEENDPPQQLDHRQLLLLKLKSLTPDGFEKICRHLLLEAGFEEVRVTGATGDGGIDGVGILRLNKLVSATVLFQCKRFEGSVGAGVVRDFRGAVIGRAEKGLILTTGTFTSSAESEARRDGAVPIELIDRNRLLDLFEEMQIGLINPRTVFDLDAEFFNRFSAHESGSKFHSDE